MLDHVLIFSLFSLKFYLNMNIKIVNFTNNEMYIKLTLKEHEQNMHVD